MNVNLVLLKKDGSQKAFSVASDTTVIGRRHDCDLVVPLMDVSKRHCELSQNKETMEIRDLESRNGTFLNDKRINEAPVKAGDYIRIGPLTFLLQIDGVPEKIVPLKPAQPKPTAQAAAEEKLTGSFPELELDDSDSFLAELEDI